MSFITKLTTALHEQGEVLSAKIDFLHARVRNGFKHRVILLYPERPRRWHLLYGIAHQLGLSISTDPTARFDCAMVFWDITVRPQDPVLEALGTSHSLINALCADISKKHVEQIFSEVFGYGLEVDPRTYTGAYVKKSDNNATHDGKVMRESSEPEEGYIYQRLINNQVDDKTVRDMRVFICYDTIPFVFYRYKSMADRFDHTIRVQWNETDTVLSKDEQQTIFRFVRCLDLIGANSISCATATTAGCT